MHHAGVDIISVLDTMKEELTMSHSKGRRRWRWTSRYLLTWKKCNLLVSCHKASYLVRTNEWLLPLIDLKQFSNLEISIKSYQIYIHYTHRPYSQILKYQSSDAKATFVKLLYTVTSSKNLALKSWKFYFFCIKNIIITYYILLEWLLFIFT